MIQSLRIVSDIGHKRTLAFALLLLCLGLMACLSLAVGVEPISLKNILSSGTKETELFGISRLPRTVTLILTGAGLSISGVILQQLSQNKFISPTTSGTLDSAKLGILFGLLFFPEAGMLTKLICAVVFCFMLTAVFTFSISHIVKRNLVLIPVLGVMYGYILNALTNVIGVQFNIIQNMESWMVGNFARTLKGQYEVIYLLIPLFIICYFYAHRFTIIGLGRDFTTNLGISYRGVVNVGIMLTSISVSTTVLTVGAIPFIDLVIPNLVSLIHGDNVHKNLPFTACYGALTLLICDIIGRLIIFPYEMPSSMIVGSLGALVFLFMLIKKGR